MAGNAREWITESYINLSDSATIRGGTFSSTEFYASGRYYSQSSSYSSHTTSFRSILYL